GNHARGDFGFPSQRSCGHQPWGRSCEPGFESAHSAIPYLPQTRQIRATFRFVKKTFHPPIGQKETPLVCVAVLKDAAAIEVIETHRAFKAAGRFRGHRVRLIQLSEGKMEGVAVPMDMPV